VPAGGPELHATHLSADLFEAAAMKAVGKDLLAMKVAEPKEELPSWRRVVWRDGHGQQDVVASASVRRL
jgi:hypothetical protein